MIPAISWTMPPDMNATANTTMTNTSTNNTM